MGSAGSDVCFIGFMCGTALSVLGLGFTIVYFGVSVDCNFVLYSLICFQNTSILSVFTISPLGSMDGLGLVLSGSGVKNDDKSDNDPNISSMI